MQVGFWGLLPLNAVTEKFCEGVKDFCPPREVPSAGRAFFVNWRCPDSTGVFRGISPRGERLAGKHIHTVYSVFARSPLLGCGAETIKARGDVDFRQPNAREIFDELCLRQSAGDSTCPQIDVAPGVLWKLDIEGNIRQMEAAPALENADDFGKRAFLLRHEVQDAI